MKPRDFGSGDRRAAALGSMALDSPVAVVLLTGPSLRSDSVVSSFEKLKGAAPARPKNYAPGEEHMMVLFG